jgi:hypothetical protein
MADSFSLFGYAQDLPAPDGELPYENLLSLLPATSMNFLTSQVLHLLPTLLLAIFYAA